MVFTGLEHVLQLFCSVLLVLGLIYEQKNRRVVWWLGLAIIVGPLIRYENLALSVPALGYLIWRKYYGQVAVWGITLISLLSTFSLFLYKLDFGFLPGSVLLKSDTLSNGLWGFLAHLGANLYKP